MGEGPSTMLLISFFCGKGSNFAGESLVFVSGSSGAVSGMMEKIKLACMLQVCRSEMISFMILLQFQIGLVRVLNGCL